jgi:EmrB/QacA subfamily drug resistance transporter
LTARTDDSRRWLALYVLCMGCLMMVLDGTIVNVALPSIQRDLHFTQSNLAWIVNAYLIGSGGVLLLSGRLGDLLGRRRIFLSGLTVFTVASLLCAGSQNQAMLVAARFVQGVSAALTSSVILGMIVTLFPDRRDRAKALGVYSFVAATGGSIGLVAGGLLTGLISWHWIFLVNLPLGVATVVFARKLIEDDVGRGWHEGADIPSAMLLTAGLMLGVYTILQVESKGWGSSQTLVLGVLAIALIVVFVLRQARIERPLVPLRLFRSRNMVGANIIQALSSTSILAVFYMVVLYLQRVKGYSPLEVGLAYAPSMVSMSALSLRVSGSVNLRFGPKATWIACLAMYVMTLLLFARIPVHSTYAIDILPPLLLLGVGAGLGTQAGVALSMSGVAPRDSGFASGLVGTTAMVGGALGLAVLAALAAARTASRLHDGVAANVALTDGYRLAFLIGAILLALALLVAVFVIRTEEHSVEKTSDSLAEYAFPAGPGRSLEPGERAGRHTRQRLPVDAQVGHMLPDERAYACFNDEPEDREERASRR